MSIQITPMNLHHSPPELASPERKQHILATEHFECYENAQQKQRKHSSTGGGRAWTEQEEVYLLQTRLQKMPYKHIAAHLKKTELACRLHYHQLSHGTNRRKRAVSISSCSSGLSPVTPEQRMSPEIEVSTSLATPELSPVQPASIKLWNIREDSPNFANPFRAGSSPPTSQKPYLPRPNMTSLSHHARDIEKVLRPDCRTKIGVARPGINRERLRAAYEAHRVGFWRMIAADYGPDTHPAVLEQAFREIQFAAEANHYHAQRPQHGKEERRYSHESSRRLESSAPRSLVQDSQDPGFSPVNARAQSAAPSSSSHHHSRSYTLATPTSLPAIHSASIRPHRATAIANLLTENVEMRRPLNRNASAFSTDRDSMARDLGP